MIAKKCDRCGKFYEYYEEKLNKSSINSIASILSNKSNSLHHERAFYDLCPDCMRQFIKWINMKNTIVISGNISPLVDDKENNDD